MGVLIRNLPPKERPVKITGGERGGKEGLLIRWTNWAHAKAQVKLSSGEVVIVLHGDMDPIWPARSGCGARLPCG